MTFKKIFYILILFVTCNMLRVTWVNAQTPLQSVVVYPAIIDLGTEAGKTTRFLVQFRNNSDLPISGIIKVADFTIKDKEGNPILIEGNEERPIYGASSWIKTETERMTIPANDFVAVYFNADVPRSVTTCGNYALVYFENEGPLYIEGKTQTQSASSVTSKIGALVNFTMKDKICHDRASLSNLKVPFFSEFGPVNIKFELVNQGDYHIEPSGAVSIISFFNKKTDEQNIINKRIFPGVSKEYEFSLGKKWMIGRYQLIVSGIYGLNKLPITASAYFWVFPWRLAIIIILTIIIIVLLIKNYSSRITTKERVLEEEIEKEKKEIQKLREELKKRD